MKSILPALLLACVAAPLAAQVNAGNQTPETNRPFKMTQVATLSFPWRIAFLPDARMLITEKKPGGLWLVTQAGEKTQVTGTPAVYAQGQAGMLGVYLSPTYARDRAIYLTYSEPGENPADGTSSLALARATLTVGQGTARLDGLRVIWRQLPKGKGGQFGAAIAFSPDNKYLFLTVGERQRFTPAQDPDQVLGKIVRLTLDGKPAPGNPGAGRTGAAEVTLIDPPKDTEAAKTAPVVSTYRFPAPNDAPAQIWSTGHRTPYGLLFTPQGQLWELEHGPRGGDELNLIQPGKNYGWPLVSYSQNYDGVPIPSPDTRPDLVKPVIYWNPVIAPGNMVYYNGAMFPAWRGSLLIGGMASKALLRVTLDGKGGATPADRWDVGKRIRDVAVAPDGAVWVIEDDENGGVFRVTPQ